MIILDEKVTGLKESAKAIGLSYGSHKETEECIKKIKAYEN